VEPGVIRLAMVGVRVQDVDHLPVPSIFIARHGLAFVDTHLTAEDRETVLDALFDQALGWADRAA